MMHNIISTIGPNFPTDPMLHKLLHYDLGNENYFLWCLTVVFACEKLSQHYFISFVDQLVNGALHPSFYRVIAFARWIFVLAENYQVKFPVPSDIE